MLSPSLQVAAPIRLTICARIAIISTLAVLALTLSYALPLFGDTPVAVAASAAPVCPSPLAAASPQPLVVALAPDTAANAADDAAGSTGALSDPGDVPDIELVSPALPVVLLAVVDLRLLTTRQAFPSFVSALDKPPPKQIA